MSTEKCQVNPANNQNEFFEDQCNVYDVASGTSNSGGEYEFKMCALIALNLYFDKNVTNFKISNNVKNFGKLDDIVLEVTHRNKEKNILLIQLKYLNRKNMKIESSDFIPQKKSKAYFDIVKYNPSKQLIQDLKNINYLLFTNVVADVDSINSYVKEIGPYETTVTQETNHEDILNKICYKQGKIMTFNIMSTDETKLRTPEHDGLETFIKSLYFCTDQYSIEQLNAEIQKILKNHFENSDAVEMRESYCKSFELWWHTNNKRLKLQKKDIGLKLGTMLLSAYIPPETDQKIPNENEEHANLLEEAFKKFDISICYPYSNLIPNKWKIDIPKVQNDCKRKSFLNFSDTSDENLSLKEKLFLLWIDNKAALILRFENDSWETVKTGIQMCREYDSSLHFILCAPLKRADVADDFKNILENLSDLKDNNELLDKIIQCFTLKLDQRGPFRIEEIFGSNITNLKAVTVEDCISSLETAVAGEGNENLINNYIPRKVPQLILKESLDNITEDFVIVGRRKEFTHWYKKEVSLEKFLSDCSSYNHQNIIITTKDSLNDFGLIKNKCSRFHYFEEIDKSKLEWITSYKPSTLVQMEHDNSNYISDTDFFQHFRNDLNIILAGPGMGKSVFMDYLVNVCPANYWPIKVIVRQHFTFLNDLKNIDVNIIIDYFIEKIVSEKWQKYAKQLHRTENLIILWDGLDEIPLKCLDNLIKIISTLRECKYKQILTSREFLKEKLEQEFKIRHLTILPFNGEEQTLFIEKSLGQTDYTEDEKIKIKKVIVDSIGIKRYRDILGIPLQLYLYVEVYISKYSDEQVDLNNLAIIYKQFINNKIDIVTEKNELVGKEAFKKKENFKEKNLIKYQQAAIILHFDHNLCQMYKKKLKKFFNKIREGNFECGIIINFTDEKQPLFFHETIAEYLIALFLVTHWKTSDERVEPFIKFVFSQWFTPQFQTIRYFFELLLAEGHPLHIHCLNQDYEKMLQHKEDIDWNECDAGNRSIIHLLCNWGETHPKLKKNELNEYVINQFELECSKNYKEVLKHAIKKCDVELKDNVLKMTSLEYGLKSGSLFEIESILKENKCQSSEFKILGEQQYQDYLMYYSVLCNYYEILKKLKFSNIQLEGGYSLLHLASENGHQNAVSYLLKKGIDIDTTNRMRETPLYLAVKKGHYNVIVSLIRSGANVNKRNIFELSILYWACQSKDLEIIKFLVHSGADVNHCDNDGKSTLHWACRSGNLKLVKFLVESVADVNICDNRGRSILHWACESRNLEMVKFLVQRGMDVNQYDNRGESILHWACINGNLETAKFLVQSGADFNQCDSNGKSILHWACKSGNLEIVKFLIQSGADFNQCSSDGDSILHWACRSENLEIVKFLVQSGANITQCDNLGHNVLYSASEGGNLEIVKFLVENNVSVNKCNTYGQNALHRACKGENLEIVKFLVENGADIYQSDKKGWSILHWACMGGNLEIVKYLIEIRGNVYLCDVQGRSVVDIAEIFGHLEIVQFLKLMNA